MRDFQASKHSAVAFRAATCAFLTVWLAACGGGTALGTGDLQADVEATDSGGQVSDADSAGTSDLATQEVDAGPDAGPDAFGEDSADVLTTPDGSDTLDISDITDISEGGDADSADLLTATEVMPDALEADVAADPDLQALPDLAVEPEVSDTPDANAQPDAEAAELPDAVADPDADAALDSLDASTQDPDTATPDAVGADQVDAGTDALTVCDPATCPSPSNPCQVAACNADTTCGFAPAVDGTACDDNDVCTLGDACASSVCLPGTVTACADGNACTNDGCDGTSGCVNPPNSATCSDGDACTVGDSCVEGACIPVGVQGCDDANACTADSCDSQTGACGHTAIANCWLPPCSGNGDCAEGVCEMAGHVCVDCLVSSDCGAGFACQKQHCAPATPCVSSAECKASNQVCGKAIGVCVDCLTAADCALDQACVEFTCTAAPPCKSDKDCPVVCDTGAGVCVDCLADGDCAAGNFCASWHACSPAVCSPSACLGATAYACNASGSGFDAGTSCDDAKACTVDACQPAVGCTHDAGALTGTSCDDANACTVGDLCVQGVCASGAPDACDDGEACTIDSCGLCDVSQCNDASHCRCVSGTTGLGCKRVGAVNATCNDGNACTQGEVCTWVNGTGAACNVDNTAQATNCDDANSCTADACDPTTGCTHAGLTASCNDGNSCSFGDACDGGACLPAGVTTCDDGLGCTTDACDGTGGCVFTPVECATGATCTEETATCTCLPGYVGNGQVCSGNPTSWGIGGNGLVQKVVTMGFMNKTLSCEMTGDNKTDNVWGGTQSLIGSNTQDAIDDGKRVTLLEPTSYASDGTPFTFNVLDGAIDPTDKGHNPTTAGGKYTVNKSSYDLTQCTESGCLALQVFSPATIVSSKISAPGNLFVVAFNVSGIPLTLPIRGAQFSGTTSNGTSWVSTTSGRLCGYIRTVDTSAAIDAVPDAVLLPFGGKNAVKSLILSLVPADIDLDGNGVKDASSIALSISTLGGTVTGMTP